MSQLRFDFAESEERLLADRLREGTKQGLALRTIAKQLGLRLTAAFSIAQRYDIHYKHRHQTPATIAQAIALVRNKGLTMRQAAAAVGMSKTAVNRFVIKKRQKAVDADGGIRFEQSHQHGGKVKPWRCPEHGMVEYSPCVICEAEKAR